MERIPGRGRWKAANAAQRRIGNTANIRMQLPPVAGCELPAGSYSDDSTTWRNSKCSSSACAEVDNITVPPRGPTSMPSEYST
jgi:hypothetical protein